MVGLIAGMLNWASAFLRADRWKPGSKRSDTSRTHMRRIKHTAGEDTGDGEGHCEEEEEKNAEVFRKTLVLGFLGVDQTDTSGPLPRVMDFDPQPQTQNGFDSAPWPAYPAPYKRRPPPAWPRRLLQRQCRPCKSSWSPKTRGLCTRSPPDAIPPLI